ncbi:MAG: hypothetical protein KDK27_06865 [Leptospiraceae bacterium]|nr:hypothetical protein [Leptospiraceae bacterium]
MQKHLNRHFTTIVLILAALAIISRVWVTEDAYITFRVVENLYAGHGLTFNPGTRVEASTHPLWVMVLIALKGLGLDLHPGSILAGLVFSLSAVFYVALRPGPDGKRVFPAAVLILCSIPAFNDFATAGMEYSLVFLLLALFVNALDRYSLKHRPIYYSSLLSLMYLCRPELGLMLPYYSLFFLYDCFSRPDPYGRYGIPYYWRGIVKCVHWGFGIMLFAGSYHLFRFLYYGDVFPNTYYAKAGLSTYYIQGWKYLYATLAWAPALSVAVLGLMLLVLLFPFRRFIRSRLATSILRELGIAALLIAYIIRVGGDFMAVRFLLPEIMLFALTVQRVFYHHGDGIFQTLIAPLRKIHRLSSVSLEGIKTYTRYAILAVFVLLFFIPQPPSRGYIADERGVFLSVEEAGTFNVLFSQNHPWGAAGRRFHQFEACLQPDDFWITNSITHARCLRGMGLGYSGVAAGPGVKIIDEQALPNRDVADLPVVYRWRPGHEHYLDLNFVVRSRAWFCSSGEPQYDRVMRTNPGILITLNPDVLATVPHIGDRLAALQRLKDTGSVIVPWLEEIDGVALSDLQQMAVQWENDPLLQKRSACWNRIAPSKIVY